MLLVILCLFPHHSPSFVSRFLLLSLVVGLLSSALVVTMKSCICHGRVMQQRGRKIGPIGSHFWKKDSPTSYDTLALAPSLPLLVGLIFFAAMSEWHFHSWRGEPLVFEPAVLSSFSFSFFLSFFFSSPLPTPQVKTQRPRSKEPQGKLKKNILLLLFHFNFTQQTGFFSFLLLLLLPFHVIGSVSPRPWILSTTQNASWVSCFWLWFVISLFDFGFHFFGKWCLRSLGIFSVSSFFLIFFYFFLPFHFGDVH